MDYAARPKNLDEVLKILAKTPYGRELLERFLPLLIRKHVRIEAYPEAIVRQLREVLDEGQPIGAAFVQDGSTGTIYLDSSSPVGVLAPFLAHEISHALNPAVWSGESSRHPTAQVDAELKAFTDQFRFTQELKERDPAFAVFLKGYLPKARILHDQLFREDIEELYHPDAPDGAAKRAS